MQKLNMPGAASSTFLALTLILANAAYAKTYPPGGNVTSLSASKTSVVVGETFTFTVNGSGKCGVQLFGFPNATAANLRASGPLPLTISTSMSEPGTFSVYADTTKEPTDPMWCTGGGSVQLTVKPKTVAPVLSNRVTDGNARVEVISPPKLIGLQLAADWYDFKNKRITMKILGSGDPKMKCGYQVGFHNDTTGKDYPAVLQIQETIVPSITQVDLLADLPVGNYVATVKPYQGSDASVKPCEGGAVATGVVKMPANEMTINGGALYVYASSGPPNFAQSNKKDVTVTADDVTQKRINYTVTFKNTSNTGCTFVQWITLPIGGTSNMILKVDGPSGSSVLHPWPDGYKYPGVYKIHVDGNVMAAGGVNPALISSTYPPCAGSADLTVTVVEPLQKAPASLNTGINVKP